MFKIRSLYYLHALIAVILVLSSWLPHFNPQAFWLSGFIGLLFPLCWLLNLLFIIWWIIYKRKFIWMGIGVLAIILSFPALRVSFGSHLISNIAKSPQQFSVMTFNTSSMGLKEYIENTAIKNNIYQAIKEGAPDILCLQEFYTNNRKDFTDHIAAIQQQCGYPYFYFTCDKVSWYTWQYGIIIFSKFPIVNALTIPCGHSTVGSGSSILQADVLVHSDTIRVITAQLQSYMFKSADYSFLHAPGDVGEGKSLIGRMRRTIYKRAEQARQVAGLIKGSPYPAIVCGDFNDTPVSYTYNTISNNMQDAFLEDSWGLGRTLSFLSPTLRIDYILTQPHFNVLRYQTYKKKGFEHFAVEARLTLKRN